MKVSSAKTSPRVERNVYLTSKRIKGYGQNNDYPQKILEIVNSSGTGKTCMDIYVSFVEGGGFEDLTLADYVLNSKNEKGNSLLRKCAKDLKNFNGFAILVKYSGLGLPVEYYNIPFEQCRLEIRNDGSYTGKIAVHRDWTSIGGKAFKMEDVKFIHSFNPYNAMNEMVEAGSPESYLGQVMYYTAEGEMEYPICPFDPIVTDMLTEEAVSTVKHRNAKNNFLPAGILVRKGIKPRTLDDGTVDPLDAYNQEQRDSADMIRQMQGDENTAKIWVVDVDADEEKPEFIDFHGKNYDTSFTTTEQTVQENIGKMFKVPPILRGVDVGAGFGAELMNNAYNFMNSVVGSERRMLKEAWRALLEFFPTVFSTTDILPLEYIVQVEETTEKVEETL